MKRARKVGELTRGPRSDPAAQRMSAGRRIAFTVALAALAVGLHSGSGDGQWAAPGAFAAVISAPLSVRELSEPNARVVWIRRDDSFRLDHFGCPLSPCTSTPAAACCRRTQLFSCDLPLLRCNQHASAIQ